MFAQSLFICEFLFLREIFYINKLNTTLTDQIFAD